MQIREPANLSALVKTVRETYFNRFDEMELEYQLHFASRLYAWTKDERAAQLLEKLRPQFVPQQHDVRITHLKGIQDELALKDYERDINNYAARRSFFKKYPRLLLVHNALFRIRHWYCIYGIDERESLFRLLPRREVESMLHQLCQDSSALRTLSTYAINSLYLFEKLYNPPTSFININSIRTAAQEYDRNDKKDLQLLQYLYTHCIIGETLFYYKSVAEKQDAYRQMLRELEKTLTANYDAVTLDNKFEFLVCARICDFTTTLANRIYQEAALSLHAEGFIVDILNEHVNPVKQSFLMSEHRNVLFILSTTKPVFN